MRRPKALDWAVKDTTQWVVTPGKQQQLYATAFLSFCK
jgi:hypothetical protein